MTLAAYSSFAQTKRVIEPTFLSIPEGLVSSAVNDVIQDSYGLMWIGTDNGLQRYDGNKFETFKSAPGKPTSLHNNLIWDILEDKDHNIWVATDLGVSRYERQKNEFKNFTFGAEVGIAVANGRTFNLLIDSSGRMWATNGAVELLQYDKPTDTWKRVRYQNEDIVPSGPGSMVLGIMEDSARSIWIGSGRYGLMRMTKDDSAFVEVPVEIKFVDEKFITGIYSESAANMYITTRTGVYRYNPQTNVLKSIKEYTTDIVDGNNNWNTIGKDKDGNVWIMNNFRGILKFLPNSEQYEEIFVKGADGCGAGYNCLLTDFMIDRSGIFWIGSGSHGLIKYDPSNKPFSFYSHSEQDAGSIAGNGVFGILASKVKPGFVYTGTRGKGFQVFDPKKQTFETITFKSGAPRFPAYVRSFAEDPDGSLWVGTWEDGLIKFDAGYREIARYPGDGKPGNLSNPQVRVIRLDNSGTLWIGTNNGLNTLDIATKKIKRFSSITTTSYPQELLDEAGRLMKTTQNVAVIDKVADIENRSTSVDIKDGGKYLVFCVGEGDAGSMADFGWITNATKDTVWVGDDHKATYHAGGAGKNRVVVKLIDLQPGSYTLHYVSDDSHSFDRWNEERPSLTSLYGIALIKTTDENQVTSIQKLLAHQENELVVGGDNIGDICIGKKYVWVASIAEGLTRLDLNNNSTKYYLYDPANEDSPSSNTVNSLYEDEYGTLWMATTEGLCKMDIETGKFTRYYESDGLPTNLIGQIVAGDKNEMWLGTQNGLSQMLINESLNRITFINYNSLDGLGGNNFLPLTGARTPDGQYYFGGDHGLTTFSQINADKTPPSVILSNLYISNRSILDIKENSPLHENLLSVKDLSLSFDQNNLSFEFAALHYANPKKNQLAHKLEGYDKDWIYDNRNFASYTNLDPGTYTLKIRASNAFGIWNEEGHSLKITIAAPWWRTWWAYGTYLGLFGLVVFSGNGAMRRNIKLKERERSREKELKQAKEIEKAYTNLKATQAQLVQSEKMASLGELTAGIAHEIQNPLNFVNNFSEINKELIEEMKQALATGDIEEAKAIATTIHENESKIIYHGKRADGIVKGMLQHSRTSTGQKEATDINALSDEYLRLAYHGLRAKDKSFNATMKTDFDPTLGKVNAIPQDLGRVILNLITNAFYVVAERKASKAAGESYEPTVSVTTKRNESNVEIKVTDNGKGIPAAIIDKIFQPFFTTKPSGQGTGLGLSLSYEIIKKGHGGELKVDTKEGEGTTFTIIIPA
jgi:signal transduction histidine kinase/ligand-binding sensor domain-containing protein